jgi:hypothetical protein
MGRTDFFVSVVVVIVVVKFKVDCSDASIHNLGTAVR